MNLKNTAVYPADILLPAPGVDLGKWAVVAVDQYTSEPEYWSDVERAVGGAASALRLTLPEVYLAESDARIPEMQANMRAYLRDDVLRPAVRNGYLLVERATERGVRLGLLACLDLEAYDSAPGSRSPIRATESGVRLGLMACLDLEAYDYAPGSRSPIRATEGTVLERVPPRVRIRRGAALELPHVLMLLNDPQRRVLEPLYAARDALESVYDFELMQGGGHLRGWKVEGDAARRVEAALDAVAADCAESSAPGAAPLFLAVGDGNHSLAAARAYWMELREGLTPAERANHPARYALAEIENLHCPAIQFEPIHRVLTGVDPEALLAAWEARMPQPGEGFALTAVSRNLERSYSFGAHPLRALQEFLDEYLAEHPGAEVDYIHGDGVLRRLADRPDAVGFLLCGFAKAELFPYIETWGVLPRKTFSMGHAHEKRYYLEARRIEG